MASLFLEPGGFINQPAVMVWPTAMREETGRRNIFFEAKEVNVMRNKKLLALAFAVLVFGMILAFAGPVAAQHTGGLGIKKIPLNIATVKQLLKIQGMTEDLANAIVEYREKSGFFKRPEDLLKVQGMTKEIFEKLDPQVGAEGDLYCVPAQEEEEEEEEEEDDEEVPLAPSKC